MEKTLSQLLDKRIKTQIIFYSLIFIGLIAIIIFQITRDHVGVAYPSIGFLFGIAIGLFASRVFHISWDPDAGRVIARLDILGIIVFILCLIIELVQERYLGYFIQGALVFTVSFAVFAGIMLGRLLGIRKQVLGVLKSEHLIP